MMQYNITIESGADFYLPLKLRDSAGDPIDLTGAAITAQLREYPEAQDYFQFTTSHNGAGGRITLSMGHEATAQIGYTAGYYDVFVDYPDETREKVLWGEVAVQPNVTKPIAGTPMVVLSFASEEEFPLSGLTDRLYLSHASAKLYRWNGTTYVGTRAEIDWEDVKEKPETFPPAEHTHDDRYYTISEMDTALERKADAGDSYTKEEEDDLLSDKADADHTHEWDEIQDKPETFPPSTHNHDDRYFTEAETTTLLSGKADANHNHDGVYSPIDHNHDADYAAIDHDHDGIYSPVGHDHDGVYSPVGHTHDYSEIENTPILGSLAEKDTVDWDTDIDNIPTEFPPESHTHDDRYYTETETDDLLDSKASIIRTSASGSLVHLTDAAAMPVESLTVGIEPVQDLHGYDAPWPAGGGKNLLKPPAVGSTVINDVTFTVNEDGTINVNGTASVNTDFYYVGANGVYADAGIPTGSYKANGNPLSNIACFYVVENGGSTKSIYGGVDTPVDIDSTKTYRIMLRIMSGQTVTNQVFKPMIRPSSVSDSSYAPYSNVCPISGHTSATVTGTGANLYDSAEAENNTFLDNNSPSVTYGQTVPVSGYWTSGFISVKAGQTYYKSSVGSSRTFFYDKDKNPIAYVGNNGGAITAPSGAFYHRFCGETNTVTYNGQVMFNVGSIATAYAPYQGQTVTIDLDGTRYGGTVDALTGVMTVDRVMVTIDGVEHKLTSGPGTYGGYTYYSCNMVNIFDVRSYNTLSANISKFISNRFQTSTSSSVIPKWYVSSTGTSIYVYLADQTIQTRADANSWFASNNTDFVVPLAEPFTVQLTPAELSMLYGTNNVWADTGDVNVGYRADTKLYIERKIAELQALILDN